MARGTKSPSPTRAAELQYAVRFMAHIGGTVNARDLQAPNAPTWLIHPIAGCWILSICIWFVHETVWCWRRYTRAVPDCPVHYPSKVSRAMPAAKSSSTQLPIPKALRTFIEFPPSERGPLSCHLDVLHYGHMSPITAGVAHFYWPDGTHRSTAVRFPDGTTVARTTTKKPAKNGRPPATARDIGVYLARCYFERRNGLRGCNDRVLDLWGRGTGFSDSRAVDKKYDNAKEHLRDTTMALLAYGGKTGDGDAVMVALERGARIELLDKHPNRCVVRGSFWKWAYGEKIATYIDNHHIEIHLRTAVPTAWLSLGEKAA